MTWSRGKSWMSVILILSYRLKKVINSYVLHCFEFKEMFISLQPDVCLRWDLDQNVAFHMDKWFIFKQQNWILPTCDSFPLIVSDIEKSEFNISVVTRTPWRCYILSLSILRDSKWFSEKCTIPYFLNFS